MASTKTWMGFFSVIKWMISKVCLTMLNTKKNNKHMSKEKRINLLFQLLSQRKTFFWFVTIKKHFHSNS